MFGRKTTNRLDLALYKPAVLGRVETHGCDTVAPRRFVACLRIAAGYLGTQHFHARHKPLLGGIGKCVSGMIKMFQNTVFPTAIVAPFGYALPWLEAGLGLLIIIGFRTREALVAGALLMLALTFGTALRQDWDVAGVQLLYSAV